MSLQNTTLGEKLVTIQAAAEILGIHTWKLRRAAKAGLVPTYSILNGRKLVRLSDIVEVIDASRQGGDHE